MKSALYFLAACLLILAAFLLAHNFLIIKVKAAEVPQIIINEIMYNPQGADIGREWVEILNVSTSTNYSIDSRWRFNDGSNHLIAVNQGGDVLQPNQYAVLADNPNLFLQDYPNFQGILLDTVMALNNTTDTLTLSVESGQNLFATTTYQAAWGASDNGFSLERINLLSDTWQQSYVSGGTPGRANSQMPAPVNENQNEATNTLPILNATSTEVINQATTTPAQNSTTTQNSLNTPLTSIVVLGYSSDILINEILPNPEGLDNETEYIELYNRSSQGINLAGWQLSDSTNIRYNINRDDFNSTEIPAYGYFMVYRKTSKIALNNTGDTVKLYQPNGSLLEQVSYNYALEQWSYAKNGDSWFWTKQVTPRQVNLIDQTDDEAPISNSPNISEKTKAVLATISYQPENFIGLRINEFLPNLQGSDAGEWIELYSNSSSILNLADFKLDDESGGSRPYVFSASTTISSHGFLIVKKEVSKISLNNTKDQVRLIAPSDEIFDEVAYEKPKPGWSYNFNEIDEDWFWSATSTPGQKNVAHLEEPEASQVIMAGQSEQFPFYPISGVKELTKGDKVKTAGVIIAPPGVLGKRIMYLAEVDLLSNDIFLDQGLQIYSSFDFPSDLKAGDVVEVSGKVSQVQNQLRINLIKESKVQFIKHLSLLNPSLVSLNEIDDSLIGGLIKVSGEVTDKKGDDYYLYDGTGEIKVSLKKIADKKGFKVELNYHLEATGILTSTNNGYCLSSRSMDDINIGEVLGANEQATTSSEIINMPADNKNQSIRNYLLMAGGAVLVALVGLLIKFRK